MKTANGLRINQIKKIACKYGFKIIYYKKVSFHNMEEEYSGQLTLMYKAIDSKKQVEGSLCIGFRNDTECQEFFYNLSDPDFGNEFSLQYPDPFITIMIASKIAGLF